MATCRERDARVSSAHAPSGAWVRLKRNSLSGKHTTCPAVPRGTVENRLISGKPSCRTAEGNPEGSPSDPLTTDPKGEACHAPARPEIHVMRNTPALIRKQSANGVDVPLNPWFVSGLTEGEGCFCASFAIRSRLRTGLEVRPSFALALNERDSALLTDLRAFFGCGWLRRSRSDRTLKYEVRAISDLTCHVLPHFERYPLRGCKARSCAGFSRVCQMIVQGDHLQCDGLRASVEIAYRINSGKRRHSEARLLQVLDEVKG
jgi:LAGLIDADG endonuclease